MSDTTWEAVRYGEWRAVDSTGRILGRVERGHLEYRAFVSGGGPIGEYTTEEYAKRAVDRALTQASTTGGRND